MSYDAGNPDDVKDAKTLAHILKQREQNGFAKICADSDCRFVLAKFFEHTLIFNNAFHSNPTDHAFNEGTRNAGLWWLNKALLHDGDIMSKIQADKDMNQKAGLKHDNGIDSDTSGE